MLYNKKLIRFTAKVMLIVMVSQLVLPATQTFALTSGPSQPEVQSFEPVGTTDMVDMFSGDFVYNIPLMDVEGYPINISYHGGIDMEQEASWVGLGWNINPGVINRSVRGLPDDMNGETVTKYIHIKDEKNITAGVGATLPFGGEFFGIDVGASIGADVSANFSNYRGVSANIGVNAGVNIAGMASAGVNLGVGSQSGADVDLYGGLQFSSSKIIGGDVAANCGFSFGSGYNSRTGLKDRTFGWSVGISSKYGGIGTGGHVTVPIGVKNMVPVITNASTMSMYRGRIKLGGELFWNNGYLNLYGSFSKLHYSTDGSRPGFGYLYAQNGNDHAIMDFTRDKDGMFNQEMKFLPLGNMTYDVYNVSGQGTGGSFRPFRNDYGSVFDPVTSSENDDLGVELEFSVGNLFEVGADVTTGHTDIKSGPWDDYQRMFTGKKDGSIYENVYFKQAGEITANNSSALSAINGLASVDGIATVNIPEKKPGSESMRDARGNLIYYYTAEEAAKYGVAHSGTKIRNYTSSDGFGSGTDDIYQEVDRTANGRKASQISEIVQVQTDGRRYIYGIPAMNTSQDEVTFATDADGSSTGLVAYSGDGNNNQGRDEYFSKTSTPAYAHSYLLTSVLSADYIDIKGDGVTDDDFGSFTKFNYSRKNDSYHWKSPYQSGMAQFNQGFKSDKKDNKANYIQGTKEMWMLHSVETKNFVAEFYTSARDDARGVNTGSDISYKLDSIKLYNKHDRLINTSVAIPVKTVIFNYNYELCPGVPNNINSGGKLTLKKIFVRYGNSEKSMLSPYQFSYASNKNYSFQKTDRWGSYASVTNSEYPYVNQNDAALDENASAWTLNKITLPSGGTIELQYEMDDYAYVMDQPAMEMFKIAGVGKSANYSSGNILYSDKKNPNLFLYFNRRQASENPNLSFKNNYFKNAELIYYNTDTRLTNNSFEPIKGYAKIADIGICGNDATKGYVQLVPQEIIGGGASLNPISYTAINFGRYYLPHIIFPGSDPDQGFLNILAGLKYALTELVGIMKNPVKRMTEEGKAQDINLTNSYIRLTSPGLKKKGGGQRVKTIQFYDHWDALAGGNAQNADYGKAYDYTTNATNGSGKISSGVASYEPMIGGDENPLRSPVDYVVQSGGNFPPHDPIGLYQEKPIGESLYPGPSVGYSKVTVTSIHQQEGRSSQGEDIYEFYTARDFPIKTDFKPLNILANSDDANLTSQKQVFEASQGYTLTFNDMHGKPRRTEHRIIKPSTGESELVSYKEYNYFTEGGQLSNNVPVVAYDATSGKMKKQNQVIGIEADFTIDTREKKEESRAETYRVNLNVSMVGVFPIPFPMFYYESFNSKHEFRSVVATKVIQQYGILKEVVSSEEGAVTRVQNEAFDPVTGQALITSVNNEYNDREYSVNYPAYWGYKSMGPSYQNTGFEQSFSSLDVNNYEIRIPGVSADNYKIGDELYMKYKEGGVVKENNAWIIGMYRLDSLSRRSAKCRNYTSNMFTPIDTVDILPDSLTMFYESNNSEVSANGSCGNMVLIVKPRFKYSFPQNGVFTDIYSKVVRSGAKNQLTESIQSYTGMSVPFNGNGVLKNDLDRLISISAREYSDTLTAILPQFDSILNPTTFDSLNIYVNGTRQIKRVSKEYAYIKNRDYLSSSMRETGLFSASSLWAINDITDNCIVVDTACYCIIDGIGVGSPNHWATFFGVIPGNDVTTGIWTDGNGNLYNQFNQVINNNYWGGGITDNNHVYRYFKIIPASYVNDYRYVAPHPSSDPNWVIARAVTKYSPWGFELENKDAIGNYTAAVYDYNHQLPTALAQNARQHEILTEGFEDYAMLQVANELNKFNVSPFQSMFALATISNNGIYKRFGNTSPMSSGTVIAGSAPGGGSIQIAKGVAHTGLYSLHTLSSAITMSLDQLNDGLLQGQPHYMPAMLENGKSYIISYWLRPGSILPNSTGYAIPSGMEPKSNIIDGWQQMEHSFIAGSTNALVFPANTYIDDIRIYPADANMKAFVYNPANQKLMATLDENNFATFYEYDQEGNLIRTKKETEKGIMTVMESRSANVNTAQ